MKIESQIEKVYTMTKIQNDYSLTGLSSKQAIEKGLADAMWYTTPVPREKMKALLTRRDGPAIRDTIIWFTIMAVAGIAGFYLWGTWWAILPFMAYGFVYGTTADSRWHETEHGTAFKTDWMNNVLYQIASFMVLRESTVWRWSHTRHHSDTVIVGRDPEIGVMRPPNLFHIALNFFMLLNGPRQIGKMFIHAFGKLTADEATFIPESEQHKVYFTARIYLLILGCTVGLSIYLGSILPLMYIGLPSFYGAWMLPIYTATQHAGLAENVLDHRLNCRTIYMNWFNRYFYWNMNYHLEHHMFPLVPYHNLAKLHELIKHDTPPVYPSIYAAFKELVPAVLRQVKDPYYCVELQIPNPAKDAADHTGSKTIMGNGRIDSDGWIEICNVKQLETEDVLRFDHCGKTYAIYQTQAGKYYATDGMCTHGDTHLASGFVSGDLIECPKHNGRFDVTDGATKRDPVCINLVTYPIRAVNNMLWIDLSQQANGARQTNGTSYQFKVASNKNIATYIKELVLEPINGAGDLTYTPGDYLQVEIPPYELSFDNLNIDSPYETTWKNENLFKGRAVNHKITHRNYSLASNSDIDRNFHFNIRINPAPLGLACSAGIGSSYIFSLKPGDVVSASGPMGTFHPKESDKEMVYLGGGSGMAPLKAHISYLFDTLKTTRRVSFWYGARSVQELFYQDYFNELADKYENFTYHVSLSEPIDCDQWSGHTGYIHEILNNKYLNCHQDPTQIEYYFCGPPPLIKAAKNMLGDLNVAPSQISNDVF